MFRELESLYRNGEIKRDIDEKYAGGVYDFAVEYVYNYYRNVLQYSDGTINESLDIDSVIEVVYNLIYDIIEEVQHG